MVARVLGLVARWLLIGTSQKNPPPSFYDILDMAWVLSSIFLIHIYIYFFFTFYHLPGKNCKSDHLDK